MVDTRSNGHNEASDFKRKNKNNEEQDIEEEQETQQQDQKAQEYIKGMMAERMALDKKHPIADRLLEIEIESVQKSGKPPARRYINLYREKPIKLTTNVLVPIREHPRFNFVGKLLGPKGNTLKRLQEDTMCRMAIVGRGSMKDRKKEEELRAGMDTKYAHLSDDLHVEVSANGPPAEVHARMAYALAELRKYLIPDGNDFIRQEQMRELSADTEADPNKRPQQQGAVNRPTQNKVLSILDKARTAMEETNGTRQVAVRYEEEPAYEPTHEPTYAYHHPGHAPAPRPKYARVEAQEYEPEYRQEFYRAEPQAPPPAYYKPVAAPATSRFWKPTSYTSVPRGNPEEIPMKREFVPRPRHVPYTRPTK